LARHRRGGRPRPAGPSHAAHAVGVVVAGGGSGDVSGGIRSLRGPGGSPRPAPAGGSARPPSPSRVVPGRGRPRRPRRPRVAHAERPDGPPSRRPHRFRRCPLFPARAADERGTRVTVVLEATDAVVRRGPREVLHGVSLALHEGDAVALVGPNAAGKSTLVRTLAGLLRPERGRVLLRGRAVAQWDRDARARTLALVTPEEDAPAALTVEDRVALGRYPHCGPFRPLRSDDHAAIAAALAVTGIEALARRALLTLSAGERQLAALARGLAQQPRVLLLDEPGAHLDVGHQLGL